jgi:hypothetical protein
LCSLSCLLKWSSNLAEFFDACKKTFGSKVMGLWDKFKKIVAPQQEPVTAATPSADVLRKDIEFAASYANKYLSIQQLIVLAPLRKALRDALLQKPGKVNRFWYLEVSQRCWFLTAQQVRHDYAEVREEVRAAMARGLEYGRKVQNAREEQILSNLLGKLDEFPSVQPGHGRAPRSACLRVMKERFFTLPETNDLTDNLMLTRTILRDFLPQFIAGQLDDLDDEFHILLTEQARGLNSQDLLEDTEVTQVLKDTTGLSESEANYYLEFYRVTKATLELWNRREWSAYLTSRLFEKGMLPP